MDDKQKEEENRRVCNRKNVQLDAWKVQTMDQDFDFDDEDYENVDKEMRPDPLLLVHFSQTTMGASNDVTRNRKYFFQTKTHYLMYPIEMKCTPIRNN